MCYPEIRYWIEGDGVAMKSIIGKLANVKYVLLNNIIVSMLKFQIWSLPSSHITEYPKVLRHEEV